tara:strand:- start:545 stop:964 length:420 start_codon:yes stop_codon:yes gene_type:complete
MKKLIIIALTLVLTSCGSTYNLSTDYKIKSILTITEAGDTLAVPVRDFKFRILDRRIRELIDRDPFRYQYRQNWYRGNYNMYPIPNYNQGYNYNKPNSSVRPKPKPVNPPTTIRPYKPTSPINIKPIVKPNNNKKNERK